MLKREEILGDLHSHMNSLYGSGKYYISLPPDASGSFEESYWHTAVDPDGKERHRLREREQFIGDIEYVLKYLICLKPGKILDIGCGLGWFLSALPNVWDKYGLEVSKTAAKHAKEYGNIYHGALKDAPYAENFFDIIFIHHVIEHMEKPEKEIRLIRRILKPCGVLILGTPDFDSGCARRFGRQYRLLHDKTHVSLFSNDSMHRFLRNNNFEIQKVEYPFFETRFFTKENLLKLFDTDLISPPFYGNFMTFFCINQK